MIFRDDDESNQIQKKESRDILDRCNSCHSTFTKENSQIPSSTVHGQNGDVDFSSQLSSFFSPSLRQHWASLQLAYFSSPQTCTTHK